MRFNKSSFCLKTTSRQFRLQCNKVTLKQSILQSNPVHGIGKNIASLLTVNYGLKQSTNAWRNHQRLGVWTSLQTAAKLIQLHISVLAKNATFIAVSWILLVMSVVLSERTKPTRTRRNYGRAYHTHTHSHARHRGMSVDESRTQGRTDYFTHPARKVR